MKDKEMQQYFPTTYPAMFAGKYGGIAVGDGWSGILTQLCQSIQSHIDWKNKDGVVVPQVEVLQLKEKFGSLRFYYQGGDEYIAGLVSMAESMSGITCEECGSPGSQGGQGWISTLCPTHRAERDAERVKRDAEYEVEKAERDRVRLMKQEGHEE